MRPQQSSGYPSPNSAPDDRESQDRIAARLRGEHPHAAPQPTPASTQLAQLPAHRLFTALADNVRDYAIFLLDTDGVIRYWGEGARLMKWWSRAQAEGGHLRMLYPDGGAEDGTAEAHLAAAAARGEYTGEGRRVRSDDSTFWAGVTLTALKDDDGTLLGFVKVTRDFTARRAAEAALKAGTVAVEGQRVAEEASRLKNLFMASVSHEVRAPLNALLGYLQLLGRESGGNGRQQEYIRRIEGSAQHMLEIVTDLLHYSRIEAGRFPIAATTARVGRAVEAALADAALQASASDIAITNSVSGAAAELPYFGDETRVRQIIINLVSNAIKYTDGTGRVIISAGTADSAPLEDLAGFGPWVYVRVEDNGAGIPPDRLDAIFEPFEQASAAHATRGTGLGLSISRRLARLMGGDLTVQSEPGSGSAFVLWLPVATTDDVPR